MGYIIFDEPEYFTRLHRDMQMIRANDELGQIEDNATYIIRGIYNGIC